MQINSEKKKDIHHLAFDMKAHLPLVTSRLFGASLAPQLEWTVEETALFSTIAFFPETVPQGSAGAPFNI